MTTDAPPAAAMRACTTSSSSSSAPPSDDERDWDDWCEDGEDGAPDTAGVDGDDAAASLFEPSLTLPSVPAALAHDAASHAFDLRSIRRALALDDFGTFQVINWVRAEVAAGRDPRPAVADAVQAAGSGGGDAAPRPWADVRYLQPTLDGDALLFYEYSEDDEEDGEGGGRPADAAAATTDNASALVAARAEAAALRSALAALAAVSLPPEAAAALPPAVRIALEDAGWQGGDGEGEDGDDAAAAKKPVLSPPPLQSAAPSSTPAAADAKNTAAVDRGYFGGYAGLGIHRTMLADEARTATYRAALEGNPSRLRGATVLDVGCGTGVLSLFAARGGAGAVVGVEGAAPMAALAARIASVNGFGGGVDGPVRIVHARVEDLVAGGPLPLPSCASPPPPSSPSSSPQKVVDVLVSEWMGYALFFECMLDSVIAARDAWLKPGGAIFPDMATVFVAGVSPAAADLGFWSSVHGLDLSPAADAVREERRGVGAVLPVAAHHVVTAPATVLALDLLTARPGDAEFSAPFCVEAVVPPPPREGEEDDEGVHTDAGGGDPSSVVTVGGLALWFDVGFTPRACPDSPQVLSTSPTSPQTHWHQALLDLEVPVRLAVGDQQAGNAGSDPVLPTHLRGRVSMARGAEHRSVDISLEVEACVGGAGGRAVGNRQVRLFTFAMSG
jgi:type I protein arginine methyltransferase